jgi:F420-dependent oxidoreductase-like protein
MRIGLSGGSNTIERTVEQVRQAEADGFTSMWFPGSVGGDPLASLVVAGRATATIELGTSVLQTYPCHPQLQANRAAATAAAMGRSGLTLGIGPSHEVLIQGNLGIDYSHVGRHTEEYVTILTALLRGEEVQFSGEDLVARAKGVEADVPVLVAALGPRLLRVAGELAAGTITWMANNKAVAEHVVPRIQGSAAAAGRPESRVVVGLPLAVHDDVAEARAAAQKQFGFYGNLPNYQRILAIGEADGPADAAIVGDERSVAAQMQSLFDAGATDVWASVFAVGEDRAASRARSRELLHSLLAT